MSLEYRFTLARSAGQGTASAPCAGGDGVREGRLGRGQGLGCRFRRRPLPTSTCPRREPALSFAEGSARFLSRRERFNSSTPATRIPARRHPKSIVPLPTWE